MKLSLPCKWETKALKGVKKHVPSHKKADEKRWEQNKAHVHLHYAHFLSTAARAVLLMFLSKEGEDVMARSVLLRYQLDRGATHSERAVQWISHSILKSYSTH